MSGLKNRRAVAVALLVIIIGLTYLPALHNYLSTNGDNALYLSLAEALATGHGYTDIFSPDQRPHQKTLPGFPMTLAGLRILFGPSLIVIKVFHLACLALGMLGAYKLIRLLDPDGGWTAHAAWILALASPWTQRLAGMVLTETLFLAAFFWAMLWLERTWSGIGPRKVAGYMLLVVCYGLRSAGLAPVAGAGLFLLIKKRFRDAVVLAVVFLFLFVLWQSRNALAPAYRGGEILPGQALSTVDPFAPDKGKVTPRALAGRVWRNTVGYVLDFSCLVTGEESLRRELVLGNDARIPMRILAIGMLVCVLVGFGVRAIQGFRYTDLVFAMTWVMLLLWPWCIFRFLVPLLPLIYFYLFYGLRFMIRHLRLPRAAPAAFAVLIAVMGVGVSAAAGLDTLRRLALPDASLGFYENEPAFRDYFLAARWLEAHTNPDAVVLCRKPVLLYRFAHRRAAQFPFENAEEVLSQIEHFGATHVIVDTTRKEAAEYLTPTIQAHPERFEQVHASDDGCTQVWRVRPASG